MPRMPKSEREQEAPASPSPNENLTAIIGRQVVRSLGSPSDFLKVGVYPIGNDTYRVNVMVGKTPGAARVSDSFFLTADEKGNIVSSKPAIVRHY